MTDFIDDRTGVVHVCPNNMSDISDGKNIRVCRLTLVIDFNEAAGRDCDLGARKNQRDANLGF